MRAFTYENIPWLEAKEGGCCARPAQPQEKRDRSALLAGKSVTDIERPELGRSSAMPRASVSTGERVGGRPCAPRITKTRHRDDAGHEHASVIAAGKRRRHEKHRARQAVSLRHRIVDFVVPRFAAARGA